VKQVDLPERMQRAMAKQAEAEREKRARIIHAEGEFNAAQKLVDAAALLVTQPITIQLRYLQTLTEIGAKKNTTIVFPLPVEMLSLFKKLPPLAKTESDKQQAAANSRSFDCRCYKGGAHANHGSSPCATQSPSL